MKALDTNILLRYFVRDDEKQALAVKRFFQTLSSNDPAYINVVVLCELLWVLKTRYGYEKSFLVDVIEKMLQAEELKLENESLVAVSLKRYKESNVDFADALIGTMNQQVGFDKTITFDKRAAKLNSFELLS